MCKGYPNSADASDTGRVSSLHLDVAEPDSDDLGFSTDVRATRRTTVLPIDEKWVN